MGRGVSRRDEKGEEQPAERQQSIGQAAIIHKDQMLCKIRSQGSMLLQRLPGSLGHLIPASSQHLPHNLNKM